MYQLPDAKSRGELYTCLFFFILYNIVMELEGYNLQFKKRTAHQSLVDAIIETCGDHPRYNYKFWLGRISRSKLSPDDILNLVDKTKDMELKYRGGYINRRL